MIPLGVAHAAFAPYRDRMILFGQSAAAAIVKIVCSKCGCVQARARGPEGTTYNCRECHTLLDASHIESASTRRRSAR